MLKGSRYMDMMKKSGEVIGILKEIRPGLEMLEEVSDFPLCVKGDGGVFRVSDVVELFYGWRRDYE